MAATITITTQLWFIFISIQILQILGSNNPVIHHPNVTISRISFGSCANQSTPQPIWNAISDFDPQLFIWLGDNIYGDIRRPFKIFGKERTIGPWKNVPRFYPASETEMQLKYEKAKSNPGYSLLRRRTQVIGTWDDHDFGLNDAGNEFIGKNINQKLMLDFLDEPEDSPRRKQAGVYASYVFGPKGKQIKVVLLDTRYHRDPLGSDGSILGEAQWTWLNKEMNGPKTEITIIGSSIQVLSNLSAITAPLFRMESWGRFPKERDNLFKLISSSKRDGVFFISGDVHFGEITRYDCATGYPLYDITSSGLTQAVEKVIPKSIAFFVEIVAWLTPTTMRLIEPTCRYRSCTYGQTNFGAIEIDWGASPVTIKIQVRDVNGNPVTGVSVSLKELQNQEINQRKTLKDGDFQRHCTLESNLPWIVRHRLIFLFFYALAVLLLLVAITIYAVIKTSRLMLALQLTENRAPNLLIIFVGFSLFFILLSVMMADSGAGDSSCAL